MPPPTALRREKESWSNPKVLAVFFLLFVAGVTCGSVITSTILHWRFHTAAPGQMGFGQLRDKLQLTPDQEKVVTKELDDYVKYYQNIEEEREDVAEHGRRRILSILRPEQKKIFLEMFRSSELPTKSATDR